MSERNFPSTPVDHGGQQSPATQVAQPADDTLVWVLERKRNMTAHLVRPPLSDRHAGEWLTWGDARRAYDARPCGVCWLVAS